MAKFITVTIPSGGGPGTQVLVNIEQIRYVRPGSHGTSVIYFDNEDSLAATGDPATIVNQAFGK